MAIEYCRATIHSRSKGHSAVEAAAYRSATQLYDERTGSCYNYINRVNTLDIQSFVMLPKDAEEKYKDRQYLWNKVEEAETRKDSQLAKDFVIALPKELSRELQIEITKQYTDDHFVSRGLPADVSMHFDKENPHAHILVATRRLEQDGFSKYKAVDMNPIFGGKGFVINEELGKEWKDYQNKFFESKELNIKVDQNHIISQMHEGRNSAEETYYLHKVNEQRAVQSKHIALNNPELFLHVLTARNTVFTRYEIESLAYKSTDTLEEYHRVVEQALNADNIVHLGTGIDGNERYTTRYAIHHEYKLDRYAKAINIRNDNAVSAWRTDLFIQQKSLSEEQVKAVKHITQTKDLAIVIGKPGTGKTYMLNTAREIWNHSGHKVYGATVSGIASDNLQRETGIISRTISSWDMSFDSGFKFTKQDILVVDEAGMVNLYQMRTLMEQVKSSGAKIVLVGDPDQLNPIGAGAPLRLMSGQFGYSEMTDIRRQRVDWQRDITYNLALGDINAVDDYKNKGNLAFYSSPERAKSELIKEYTRALNRENISKSIIMAHRNSDILDLNIMARNQLIKNEILSGNNSIIKTNNGNLNILSGERILFTKNDRDAGVKNGNFATVLRASNNTIEVMLDNGNMPLSIELNKYNHISYGYAATVHKLQGVTVDKAYVYYGGKYWNKNLNLVALSRHREDIKMYADTRTHKNYDMLKQRLNRAEFKDSVLNYPVAFSLRYGVDPDSVIGKVMNKLNEAVEKVQDTWLWLTNKQSYMERMQSRPEVNKYDINDNTKALFKEYSDNIAKLDVKEKEKQAAIDLNKPFKAEVIQGVISTINNKQKTLINEISKDNILMRELKRIIESDKAWTLKEITKETASDIVSKYAFIEQTKENSVLIAAENNNEVAMSGELNEKTKSLLKDYESNHKLLFDKIHDMNAALQAGKPFKAEILDGVVKTLQSKESKILEELNHVQPGIMTRAKEIVNNPQKWQNYDISKDLASALIKSNENAIDDRVQQSQSVPNVDKVKDISIGKGGISY